MNNVEQPVCNEDWFVHVNSRSNETVNIYIYTPIKYFLNIISSTNQLFQISIFIISLNITYINNYIIILFIIKNIIKVVSLC